MANISPGTIWEVLVCYVSSLHWWPPLTHTTLGREYYHHFIDQYADFQRLRNLLNIRQLVPVSQITNLP